MAIQGRYNDDPPAHFPCGHPRLLGNIRVVAGYANCLICCRAYQKAYKAKRKAKAARQYSIKQLLS